METKVTEEQSREIEEKILAYAKAGVYSISKKEQADFKRLVLEYEEIAKKVYRETVWSRNHILMFLNEEGKGADIAKEEARRLAYSYELKNCDAAETQAFQAWLAGDTDEMPETMPVSQKIGLFNVRIQNMKLCYMSKVSPFTERLCAYAVKKGYVDIWKAPVAEMLSCIGVDYTRSFQDNMVAKYQIKEKELMKMYSAVFVCRKTKIEKEFYLGFMQEWIKNEKEVYLTAIEKMGREYQRKILTALQKEGLIN
ncbi:MAG: hypothetical protein HDQ99_17855 [Lachnospiraceae bacterium]|nr:hypothetical protein [Lachnospiraceae bacterium]